MPSILSSCLILLKIAMAVNDGLHSMLSSIYSIMEHVLNNGQSREPLQDTDSSQIVYCSKSQILEAFNRRRADLSSFDQTEVYVANMNPHQEITITNRDFAGKRKLSSSAFKNSQSDANYSNSLADLSNEEVCSSCPGISLASTPLPISSDTGNESEYQSCKTMDISFELEVNSENMHLEREPGSTNATLESSMEDSTSVENNQSPSSSFLRILQNKLQFTRQTLERALSNVKNPSTTNIYNLTYSEIKGEDKTSTEDSTNTNLQVSACKKHILEETARLYGNFLRNYYHQNKDAGAISNVVQNRICVNTETRILNENEVTLEENPYSKIPEISISDFSTNQTDSDSESFLKSSDPKTQPKRQAIEHVGPNQFPISLQKDRWIEMPGIEHIVIEDSESYRKSSCIPHEQTEQNQISVNGKSTENIILCKDTNNISTGESKTDQSSIKRNISNKELDLKELDTSVELDIISLERVELLKKVLKDVNASEVLEDLNEDEQKESEKCMLDLLMPKKEDSHLAKRAGVKEAKSKSAVAQTNIMDVNDIPFDNLDTEEKQISYLNELTESYRMRMKRFQIMFSDEKHNQVIDNELLGNFEEHHKIMLDAITNNYKNQLDSITRNAGICLNELCSIDTDLKTKFGCSNSRIETNSIGKDLEPSILPQPSTLSPRNKSLELAENEKVLATISRNKENNLLENACNYEKSFTLNSDRNETSTPINAEKLGDHIKLPISLSSGYQREGSLNESEHLICSTFDSISDTSALNTDNGLTLCDDNQNLESSNNVKKDISLEAEDWRNLAIQMSKNYEYVVSLLNSIDDSECLSLQKTDSTSSESEDRKIKLKMINMNAEANSENVLNSNSCSNTEVTKHFKNCDFRKLASSTKASPEQGDIDKEECLRKKNFLTQNVSFEPLEKQMEIYSYLESYLNSNENMEETKLKLLGIATDSFHHGLHSQDTQLNSTSGSECEDCLEIEEEESK